MDEDVAGTRAAGVGHRYTTCSQCNRSFLQRAAVAEEASLLEDVHSEFTEICQECERLLRQGEAPEVPAVEP